MKLRIFQSDSGDCLLLQSKDGKNILCDGGMARAMEKNVRQHLGALVDEAAGGQLDVVYVSHVDNDHISGVMRLLEDALEWKAWDINQANGVTGTRAPGVPRPPKIGGLWHNAFRDQVKDNSGRISDMLAASAPVYLATGEPELMHVGDDLLQIATGVPEALKVSRYCKADLLDIPINVLPGATGSAKLIYFRKKPPKFSVGSLSVTVTGPSEQELEDLRDGWNNFLTRAPKSLQDAREAIRRRVEEFATGALTDTPFDLRDWEGMPGFRGVTVPNLASLVLYVEEGNKTLLLTGDCQQDKIRDGLVAAGLMPNGYLHLNVLKVPHHGSENNMDVQFARDVSADHYIFCGDGSHGNPERTVIEQIYDSRLGKATKRAKAPQAANRPFKFWFSTNSKLISAGSKKQQDFKDREALVHKLVKSSGGLLTAEFVTQDYRTLSV